jgi:hypothetical protein
LPILGWIESNVPVRNTSFHVGIHGQVLSRLVGRHAHVTGGGLGLEDIVGQGRPVADGSRSLEDGVGQGRPVASGGHGLKTRRCRCIRQAAVNLTANLALLIIGCNF